MESINLIKLNGVWCDIVCVVLFVTEYCKFVATSSQGLQMQISFILWHNSFVVHCPCINKWNKQNYHDGCLFYVSSTTRITFTFTHLADTFIESDLLCIRAIHLLSVCVFPGNWTNDLCAANATLYHWATGTKHVHLRTKSIYCSFIKLRLNLWCRTVYLNHVVAMFLGLGTFQLRCCQPRIRDQTSSETF